MVDTIGPEARSRVMRAIRSKGMRPEMAVRRLAHALGYRFRLHRRDLPGTPDLVFPGRKRIVFVHGCFFHGHDCGLGRRKITSDPVYWGPKIARNRARDEAAAAALAELGWDVLTVWECETAARSREELSKRLDEFLRRGNHDCTAR